MRGSSALSCQEMFSNSVPIYIRSFLRSYQDTSRCSSNCAFRA